MSKSQDTDTKSVLVVGGAGYVGSHACKAFAEKDWRVTVYDNLSTGHRDAVRWGELITGDLADESALRRVVASNRPNVVAHFAALTSVGDSVRDPGAYYRNNVTGTLNLLQAIRTEGPCPLIFSSTAAVYGDPEQTPIVEDHPKRPINPYGHSKLMVEQILADNDAAYGLRYVALRYFNAAGADPDGEIGERHDPETHLIPLVLRAARDPNFSFSIFGNDFATPDGTCVRDFVHVSDLARAHVAAADYLLMGGASTAMNLGSGCGASVLEIIAGIEQALGRSMPKHFGPRRAGDPPALVAGADKAKELLGWNTMYSLPTIIASAAAWERKARGG